MNKSEVSRRASSGPRNMESTTVRRKFENNMALTNKVNNAVSLTQITAPEDSTPLATRNE